MNIPKLHTIVRFLLVALVAPALAHAHPGHDGHELTWDFQSGVYHPLSGWDHLLAMIAVGFWAARLGGHARFLVPAGFVTVMSLAAIAGRAGLYFPGLEAAIAASVFVLGLLIARAAKLPLFASTLLVGLFAAFHGLAHGAESVGVPHPSAFGLGFVASTAALHLIGLGLGTASSRFSANVTRLIGWVIAAAGVALLAT